MISYSLECDRQHRFDSWFRDSSAFDDQSARGLLACPVCGSASVVKAMMAPRIARGSKPDVAIASETASPVALVSPEEAELRSKIKELRDHLTKNSDYVGPRFAEEARKMHFGETDHRSIHGEATPEDARLLVEDGVEFHPLPTLPDERN